MRLKWKFYKRQVSYVFGDDPDNNAGKLYNGVMHIYNFLSVWSRINDKNSAAPGLLGYPVTTFEEYLTGYMRWQQGCQRRLQQMQESLQ